MCNIVEEYVAERVAEAKAEEAKNKDLSSIRTLMKNMHLSAEDAMSALDIPKITIPDTSPCSDTTIPQISRRLLRLILISAKNCPHILTLFS